MFPRLAPRGSVVRALRRTAERHDIRIRLRRSGCAPSRHGGAGPRSRGRSHPRGHQLDRVGGASLRNAGGGHHGKHRDTPILDGLRDVARHNGYKGDHPVYDALKGAYRDGKHHHDGDYGYGYGDGNYHHHDDYAKAYRDVGIANAIVDLVGIAASAWVLGEPLGLRFAAGALLVRCYGGMLVARLERIGETLRMVVLGNLRGR